MSDRYLTLKQLSQRAGMCERALRKHLPESLLHRNTPRGKITVLWSDFVEWRERHRMLIAQHDIVVDILRDMRERKSA